MFILNLFVGVILDNFQIIKEEMGGIRMLTDEQKDWVEIQKLFMKQIPDVLVKPPNGFRNLMWRLSKNIVFE